MRRPQSADYNKYGVRFFVFNLKSVPMELNIEGVANGTANILWLIFGGLILALAYFLTALIYCITIIGIPAGVQLFKIGRMMLHPFGYSIRDVGGIGSGCLNIIWIIFGGLELALTHILLGLVFCITIIGIGFGVAHFRLALLALLPFGKSIEKD